MLSTEVDVSGSGSGGDNGIGGSSIGRDATSEYAVTGISDVAAGAMQLDQVLVVLQFLLPIGYSKVYMGRNLKHSVDCLFDKSCPLHPFYYKSNF